MTDEKTFSRFFKNLLAPSPAFPLFSILLVLLALCGVYGYQLGTLVTQKKNLNLSLTNLEPLVPRANLVNATMLAVGQDLLKMVDKSPGAREVVKLFNIRPSGLPQTPVTEQGAAPQPVETPAGAP